MGKKKKPVTLLPFKLHRIEDFVVEGHPVIFPEDPEYKRYWIPHIKHVVEGKWGLDKDEKTGEGGYRWCPGNLYFYVSDTIIKDEADDGTEIDIRPRLRDIEWYVYYSLSICDGFSGFEGDDKYTCYRTVKKIEDGVDLLKKEEIFLEQNKSTVYNSKGELKKYMDARDYLYQTFDKPMGRAVFANEAQNIILLSTRGGGKSYISSNGVALYDFVTNGARTIEQWLDKSTSSTVVVGSEDSKKSTELLNKFKHAYEYIRTSVGAYKKDGINENGVLYWAWEGSLTSGSKNPFNNGVSEKGGKGIVGPGSQIVHVSYKNNPSAGVGYRARRMIVEEAGLLDRFETTHSENSATQKRKTKFGYTIYIGTGGSLEKIREIREAFNDPESYDCLPFKDIFNGTDKLIGCFIPAYYRNDIYRDKLGNCDYIAAFDDEMAEREALKSVGSASYEGRVISYPIVPQEMFLAHEGNVFPTDALEENVERLEGGGFKPNIGTLEYTDSSKSMCYWVEDLDRKNPTIIRHGDEKPLIKLGKSLDTNMLVFEPPSINKPAPTFKRPMYIVLYDPVHREGKDVGSSLAAVFVFKVWDLDNPDKIQFNIVAEWIGRCERMEDMHEKALKLATFYNAKILPEQNGDFVRHCRQTNRYHMLEPRPGLAIDGIINQKANYDVGVYLSPGMKGDLELYALEVLNRIVGKEEEVRGNLFIERHIRMIHNLSSLRLTEELLYYSRDGNFDYVSAFFLLSLWIRQQDLTPPEEHKEDKLKTREESIKKYFHKTSLVRTVQANPAFSY